MLHPSDAITIIAERLDALRLPWMLTGSVAAFFYGRERSTNDVDIVVDCEGLCVGAFVAAFTPEWFLDPDMVRDSVTITSGWTSIAGAYLLFSDAYSGAKNRAIAYGLPTKEVLAGHLAMAVRPRAVADAIVRLADPADIAART